MGQVINSVKLILILICLTLMTSCLSTVKLSNFPKSSTEVDFNKYSEFYDLESVYWNSENANEYYFERDTLISNKELTDYIKVSLLALGYSITSDEYTDDYIRGSHDLTAKEWGTVTAVYYKLDYDKSKLQVYIITQITQDITGGKAENRAKAVGKVIEKLID